MYYVRSYETYYIKLYNIYVIYDDTKKYRLIKGCDLQLYEGVAFSPNSKSQTEEESFEYNTKY